jgi:hypothetical protein
MSSRARRAISQPSGPLPSLMSVISPLKREGSASSSLSAFPLCAASVTSNPAFRQVGIDNDQGVVAVAPKYLNSLGARPVGLNGLPFCS